MEKKLFTIECGNVVLAIRPNGDTVIVTESNELVLDNAVMEQLVRNSGAYKSFVATKDKVVASLEGDNTQLQNEIVGLREELEHVKVAKDKLQEMLVNATTPIAKGCIVNVGNVAQGTLGCLFDINGDFIADCGSGARADRVQYLLKEGRVSLNTVMDIFGTQGGKKRRDNNVMVDSGK